MPEPIFIVGAPRSGTTLLASMLAGHARVACGPETQFFNKLSDARLNTALKDPVWPRRAVRLVTSLTLAEQPVAELFGHSKQDVQTFLAAREPSAQAVLESLTALYAAKRGKPRWAEKTPNHLLHLPKIRALYPGAPVVRIVRDPRDSALSMRQLPWASPSALANGYLWAAWFSKSQPFFDGDANTLTVRYEDLVEEPEKVLTRVCAFVGETFQPGMLETHKTGKSVSSPNESWKAQNARTLGKSRTQWQKEPNPALQRALTYTCAAGIEAFGYPHPARPQKTLLAYPLNLHAVARYEGAVLELAAQGIGLAEPVQLSKAELLLPSVGESSTLTKLLRLLKLSRLLLIRRSRNKKTYYLTPTTAEFKASWVQRLLTTLCRTLATPYTLPTTPDRPACHPCVVYSRARYWVACFRDWRNSRG